MALRGIAHDRRKNGARRALVGALAAAATALAGCAHESIESLQSRFAHGLRNAATAGFTRPGRSGDVTYHVVRSGETLPDIAARYRVRVSTIASLNHLGTSQRLEVGQRLAIPRSAAQNAVASAPPPVAAAPPRAAPSAPPPSKAPARPAPDPRLERARSLVDRAIEDYRAARFESGLAHARAAQDELGDLGDRADARKVAARAAFVAGSAQAARGEEDQASASFARVHELDPDFEPPPGWLSPRLQALFAEADRD